MSSDRFEAELKPNRRLRACVMLSGCACLLIGGLLILRLALPWPVVTVLFVLWIAHALRELAGQASGMAEVRRLRLGADGSVQGTDSRGRRQRLTLLPGTLVLPRLAWLRLGLADGRDYGELLTGDPVTDRHWHALQLIWRLNSGRFGAGT